MQRTLPLTRAGLLVLLIFLLPAAAWAVTAASAVQQMISNAQGDVSVSYRNATGAVSFAHVDKNGNLYPAADGKPAETQAMDFLADYGAAFGISDASAQLVSAGSIVDSTGATRMRYTQIHRGVPVFGSYLHVRVAADGALTAVNAVTVPGIKVSTIPALSPAQAGTIAVGAASGNKGATVSSTGIQVQATRLLVLREDLLRDVPGGTDHLVYEVEVGNGSSVREFIYVDAHSGAVVDRIEGIQQGALAPAALSRQISETSLANIRWTNPPDPEPIPAGWNGGTVQQVTDWSNEASGGKETYNILGSTAGWDSYDNAGSQMRTVNNDPGISCPNANWNGTSTNYCTNVTADDVVAHEWGHAYTQFTSGLIYQWQSGAMNEAYSDVWGETVDLLNGRGTDTPAGPRLADGTACSTLGAGSPSTDATYRWLMGEDAAAFGGAIRDMWRPECYNNPGKVSSTSYRCATSDSGGVHSNSGVVNRTYSLLVDGGTYNAQSITGIGLTKAAHIFWQAQLVYLGPASNFADLGTALQASCADLTGNNLSALSTSSSTQTPSGEIISAADCQEVAEAVLATELSNLPTQCGFTPAFVATPPALCQGQGNGTLLSIALQDWESGVGSWTVGTHDIANPASFTNPDWAIVGSLPVSRPGSAMFVEDSMNRGACTPANTVAGALNLDSPPIVIPAGADVPRVAFDHWVSIETGWDGGNLKVSVNSGPFTVVPSAAFEVNGYYAPGAINGGGNDNPLAGEAAFTGGGEGSTATGWGQSQVNLTGIAVPGDSVVFRWDMGLDGCGGWPGWFVDDIQVYSCQNEIVGALCGNSVLDPAEQCDDGNTNNGDGCSATCQTEAGWACTNPIPGNTNGTNAVGDWSFEAGAPGNPVWTESSTFTGIPGFPFCGTTNGCPAAGVTSTGDWAIWIGGLAAGVTSNVDQSITIAPTATDLTVQMLRGVCDDPSDTVHVSLDSVDIGTLACTGVDGAFVTQTFSVVGYNDGGAHILRIGGTVGGTNGTHSNFFVDDVTIFDNIPTGPTPSVCTFIGTGDLTCNGPAQGFEGGAVPTSWSVQTSEPAGPQWGTIADCGESGNFTNGTGGAACVSSDVFGPAEFDASLVTPVFSLVGFTAASLNYTVNFQNLAGSDFLDVDISTDGGTTWTNLLSWNENHGSFRAQPGENVSVDLAAYAGQSDLQVRYRYYDPNTGDWNWYAQVDNVALACSDPANDPDINVSPLNMASTQATNTSTNQLLNIANTGGAAGTLNWTIDEEDAGGGGGPCQAPSDIPWLSLDMTAGANVGGTDTDVAVTFDSTGLAVGTYTGNLCVNSDDPDAGPGNGTDLVMVPVTMTVTGPVTYTVTPSADSNGSIAPNTPQTVNAGATTMFTVTPDPGYSASVGGTCGGTLVGTTYTTNAITADCTVDATFTAITYTVTPSAGSNGTIAPNVPQTVNSGATTTFTVTPDPGYAASVGGTCSGALVGTTYTTGTITADCTVDATFTLITHTVSPVVVGGNGSVTPNTPQTVPDGGTVAFTLTPDLGYEIDSVSGCGGTLVGNVYTTAPITADCTVTASFRRTLTAPPRLVPTLNSWVLGLLGLLMTGFALLLWPRRTG